MARLEGTHGQVMGVDDDEALAIAQEAAVRVGARGSCKLMPPRSA
jgi:hypothetical protein